MPDSFVFWGKTPKPKGHTCPIRYRRNTDVIPTLLFGVLPAGLLIMILAWPSAWPGVLDAMPPCLS